MSGGAGQPFALGLAAQEHLLEQPRPRFARAVGSSGLTELRQQPRQLSAGSAGQQLGHSGDAKVTHEPAKHSGERSKRQALRAELQAAADQHPRIRAARPGGELTHQPGFSDPGLPADDNRGRTAAARLGQRGIQRGKLTGPADQKRTRHPRFHISKHAS